ncbi:MAG: hypothetical protein HY097_10135 [Nitrospinae bacterium]|nr:hypothetical protein [Nitrospinota bacterium]
MKGKSKFLSSVLLCLMIAVVATWTPGAQAAAPKLGGKVSTANRYKCPIDKPQKVYGHAINASAVLDKDETWTPDNVYIIFGPFHVKKSLTIKAGTVVCFDYGPPGADGHPSPPAGSINIEEGATLKVLGTVDKHVVFAQKNDSKQYWGGIYFGSGSKTGESTMQYLDVYNAGLSASSGVLNTVSDDKAPPLDMQHVTYYSIQRVGIKNLTSGFTPESRIVVNNYAEETPNRDFFGGYPVLRVHVYGAHTVTDDVLKVGDIPKPTRYVQLDHAEGMNIELDVHLHKLQDGLTWRNIQNMKMSGNADDPPSFILDPGSVLAVNNGGYINIGDGGNSMANIVAVGNKDKPIVFTSDSFTNGNDPEPGNWTGIYFSPGNFKPNVSKFEYVIFEYGGDQGKNTVYNCSDKSNKPAVIIFGMTSNGRDYEGPPIKNSIFRKSASSGVRSRCNGQNTGCLLTNYEDKSFGNTFEGFDNERLATTPLRCP